MVIVLLVPICTYLAMTYPGCWGITNFTFIGRLGIVFVPIPRQWTYCHVQNAKETGNRNICYYLWMNKNDRSLCTKSAITGKAKLEHDPSLCPEIVEYIDDRKIVERCVYEAISSNMPYSRCDIETLSNVEKDICRAHLAVLHKNWVACASIKEKTAKAICSIRQADTSNDPRYCLELPFGSNQDLEYRHIDLGISFQRENCLERTVPSAYRRDPGVCDSLPNDDPSHDRDACNYILMRERWSLGISGEVANDLCNGIVFKPLREKCLWWLNPSENKLPSI